MTLFAKPALSMKDDTVYKKHILDAIEKIEGYVHDVEKDVFMHDFLIQDGVVRELEIIGEAAKSFSPEFKEKTPAIPWREVVGMRNKLIHEYFEVDLDAVWKTVEEDVPFLKNELSKE